MIRGRDIKGKKVKKRIPKNAKIIPYIPESDYFSDVNGVYYHFGKMEWRSICHDPINHSRRWQKTFSVRKYGFYSAKSIAELTSFKSLKESNHSKRQALDSLNGVFQKDICLESTNYFFYQPTSPEQCVHGNDYYLSNYAKMSYIDTNLNNTLEEPINLPSFTKTDNCATTHDYFPRISDDNYRKFFGEYDQKCSIYHNFHVNLPESWNIAKFINLSHGKI